VPDFEVKFNTIELLAGASEAFHQANEMMVGDISREVVSNKWAWPRKTIRERGDPVGSPRNIIDTTAFQQSQGNKRVSDTEHEHRFDTDYALAVVLGAKLSNGTVLPARNVFEEPVKKLPQRMEALAKIELAKIKDPPT